MKSSKFWVVGFFEKFITKKVHASKLDTPRLKSMIFSYKMRCFPAFYVVVKWPPQRVFIIHVLWDTLYVLSSTVGINHIFKSVQYTEQQSVIQYSGPLSKTPKDITSIKC
jgi:hypothetical protein